MAQWTNSDGAGNSVNWAATSLNKGSGKAARASNNTGLFANTTQSGYVSRQVVGQFGVSRAEIANTTGEGAKVKGGPGWYLRKVGMGPVLTLTAVNGSGFANNETVLLHGGAVNAVANLTCNATGNLVSATISSNGGGVFVNASSITMALQRQKHLVANITVTGTGAGVLANTNTLRASNGIINGTATLTTNTVGGLTNSSFTITNVGLWGNSQANNEVVFTVLTAGGATDANAVGYTFVANLATSTGGTVAAATLGGRAARVTYEPLVSFAGDMLTDASDDTQLPE